MTIWRGFCGVCRTEYEHPDKCEKRPNATFCPECRSTGMMAPGVVNWSEYKESKYPKRLLSAVGTFFNVDETEATEMLDRLSNNRGVG